MKTAILSLLFFTGIMCQAQTKVISYKSHSGSKSSFAKAYRNNLFDLKHSNFGIVTVRIRRLDTIIAVNNSITLVKYRESIAEYNLHTKFEDLEKSDFIHKTDTISNNQILNKKNTVKFIKKSSPVLFDTPIDEVVFIGFKNN
ncbi:hypothetical protein SAMN06265349_101269 [Flavobacterium resistens]|uniref:Uncharacterized protein n=1 Tax=Flavobacterium resistens TaxID=443612 RepID=A0A521ANH4_9FLAO|nr:hypothetical protein [Flavobacterium resistens]MRX69809.1 hypothetical protein [Flavobacterium resistens]SMO36379.1 hypothetical protein SAMN06265349_101269 [Flavobacterium resistens]